MRRASPAFLALLLLGPSPFGKAQDNPDASRFLRTAVALQAASADTASAFADISLAGLVEAYAAEADLARHEAREDDDSAGLVSWSRAVDQYAEQLLLVLEDVAAGYPVAVRVTHGRLVALAVGGRTVILSHPRQAGQAAYERGVLDRFCSITDCKALTATGEAEVPIPVSAGNLKPEWTFGEKGARCSHRGLAIEFSPSASLREARSLCREFMQEASDLAADLAWQQRHGVRIDWEALASQPVPGRPGHLVRLNGSGDTVLRTIPLLHATPGILPRLAPWLRARYGSGDPVEVTLRAVDWRWE